MDKRIIHSKSTRALKTYWGMRIALAVVGLAAFCFYSITWSTFGMLLLLLLIVAVFLP